MSISTIWKKIIATVFIVLLLIVQAVYWILPISLQDIVRLHDELVFIIREYSILSAIVYISLFIFSVIFGIPISATVIGGYLFGWKLGFVYSMIGFLFGTIILCLLVRYVMSDWIQERYKSELEPLNKELKKYGLHYIIIAHSIPFMPSFFLNLATGISSMSFSKLMLFNAIAAIPLTIVYSIAGSYIHTIDSFSDVIFYAAIFSAILGLLFLLSMGYKKLFQ